MTQFQRALTVSSLLVGLVLMSDVTFAADTLPSRATSNQAASVSTSGSTSLLIIPTSAMTAGPIGALRAIGAPTRAKDPASTLEASAGCNCESSAGTHYVTPTPQDSQMGFLATTGRYLKTAYNSTVEWSATKARSTASAVSGLGHSAVMQGCKLVGRGSASYYGQGDGFAGKKTASGKRMNPNVPMVAHKTLPFGKELTFRDPETGKVATGTVEDRGPYAKGRVVDMSPSLFKKFASLSRGVLSRIEVFDCN